jgi:hypothetical protein
MRWIALLVSLSIIASCGHRTPGGILPPEKMEKVLYDYLSADIYVNEFMSLDSSLSPERESARLQKKVFLKHGISKAEFYRSYDYYMKHPDRMKEVVDSITAMPPISNPRQKVKSLKKLKIYEQDLQ